MTNNDLEQLFLRFRDSGDMRALARLFDAAAPQLMPVAAHLAARRDEADDLIQATFLSAIERADTYERGRAVLPWLLGILALHARKLRQKQGRVLELERVRQPAEADPEHLAAAAELQQAVDAACGELPVAYATIVRRHLVDGVPPIELAGELGLSNGAARVRLHRGLKLLRRALPVAFSSGGYAATTARDIASIRAVVMERAALLTGSPVPAAGFAPLGVILAFLTPVLLALPAWLVWRSHEEGVPAEVSLSTAPASVAAETGSTMDPTAPAEIARIEAESSSSNASSSSSANAVIAGNAIVRGRVLLPDGSPAVGASVSMSGSKANAERVRLFGLPEHWSNPATLIADGDGRFAFSFDPPRAFQFSMDVDHVASAEASWRWSELLPGTSLDLGDVSLEPIATIVARIVDANSSPLCSGWTLSLEAPAPTTANGRERTWCRAKCAEAIPEIVLMRVPARRATLEAYSDNGAKLEPTRVDLVANQTAHVVLRYEGPDPARRIAVAVSTSPFSLYDSGQFQVSASNGVAPPLLGIRNQEGLDAYFIDDCQPGAYDIAVSDPRFVLWTMAGVQPGEKVRAKLVGNAALRLHLTSADGTAYLGPYALRGKFTPNHSSNEFVLVDPSQTPPTDGLVTGMIPADYALTVEVAGLPTQNIAVVGLAPNEVRDVSCTLATGLTLQGHVCAADGFTLLSDVDVQLTRGDQPGHAGAIGSFAFVGQSTVPRFDQSVTTDAQGRFLFSGLSAGRWTVRASWGRYLHVDRSVDLDAQSQPMVLQQPAHGFLSGQLLVPAGAPIDDTQLVLQFATHDPTLTARGTGRAGTELQSDGSFDFGALPTGEVKLLLMVFTSHVDGETSYATASGQPHTVMIHHGEAATEAIDVRTTFPGRLREHVVIDDLAASGGTLWFTLAGATNPGPGLHSLSVDLDGTALIGSLTPGEFRITYGSKDKTWAWLVPQLITIEPGQERAHEVQLHTTARDLRCVDIAGGAVLANVEIQWRTGLGGEELESKARTDADGLLHLRMPEQNIEVRCVGDNGAFTTIAWCAGTGPLTVALRRAP